MCVCVCKDSVEPVEAGHTLWGRGGWIRRRRGQIAFRSVPALRGSLSLLCGGPWPRVTNSITRSGVIIINTLWALTARRWFIKNVDYILQRVTTFKSWSRPWGAGVCVCVCVNTYCIKLSAFVQNEQAWVATTINTNSLSNHIQTMAWGPVVALMQVLCRQAEYLPKASNCPWVIFCQKQLQFQFFCNCSQTWSYSYFYGYHLETLAY